jgi:hypothetical protein
VYVCVFVCPILEMNRGVVVVLVAVVGVVMVGAGLRLGWVCVRRFFLRGFGGWFGDGGLMVGLGSRWYVLWAWACCLVW